MKVLLKTFLFVVIILAVSTVSTTNGFAETVSRIFLPSRFSHDPETGAQLIQHTPRPEPLHPDDSGYQRQGYTYKRFIDRNGYGSSSVRVQYESWGNTTGYDQRNQNMNSWDYRSYHPPYMDYDGGRGWNHHVRPWN